MPGTTPCPPEPPDAHLLGRLEQCTARLEQHAGEALDLARDCGGPDAGRIILAAAIREELAVIRQLRTALRDIAITAEAVSAIWRDGHEAGRAGERAEAELRRRVPLQLVWNG